MISIFCAFHPHHYSPNQKKENMEDGTGKEFTEKIVMPLLKDGPRMRHLRLALAKMIETFIKHSTGAQSIIIFS